MVPNNFWSACFRVAVRRKSARASGRNSPCMDYPIQPVTRTDVSAVGVASGINVRVSSSKSFQVLLTISFQSPFALSSTTSVFHLKLRLKTSYYFGGIQCGEDGPPRRTRVKLKATPTAETSVNLIRDVLTVLRATDKCVSSGNI